MRTLRDLAIVTVVLASSGCTTVGALTSRVARLGGSLARTHAERITAQGASSDDEGTLYGVVALEAECRITPGDPEGGPGAASYSLVRAPVAPDAARPFAPGEEFEMVAAYRADADHPAPGGFPDAVILGEEDDDPVLYLRTPAGWEKQKVTRYLHREAEPAHPVLAGVAVGTLTPFALAFDIATLPIQWLIAPFFPISGESVP